MLEEALHKYGLTQKEASIYMAILERGRSTVAEIAATTRLPRSTIYSLLDPLVQRGLIFSYDHGKIKEFAAQNPQKLMADMQERMEFLKEALPEFKNVYRTATAQPQIRYYVGKDELTQMYNSILQKRNLKHYDIIAAEREWAEIGPQFVQDFKKRRAAAGISTRMILEHSAVALQRKEEEKQTLSSVKILPPAMSAPFHGGCYIFEDSVIFVAYHKQHIAVEILSPEITSVLRTMFNFMWKFLSGTV